jgi:hypothetical protein
MRGDDDSREVQAFMAAYHRLRARIADDPGILEREAQSDPSLAKLCRDLGSAAGLLELAERNYRQLFSGPTNPNFIATWRDYESRYSHHVSRVFLIALGLVPKPPPQSDHGETVSKGTDEFERAWEWEYEEATSNAEAFKAIIELAEDEIEIQAKHRKWGSDDIERARDGIHAWRGLVDGAEFDLAGVFRRRKLIPFVMIPRHVSGHYDASDPLSLMARLQQAQEAFVYGVPLGALAIMRSILEIILRKHYQLGEGKLVKLIEMAAANALFPIHLSQIQKLLKLGNDAVHPNSEELHKVAEANVEKEILSLLLIIRTLIEEAPKTSS